MSKNKHAAALGKLGGRARAQALSKERRTEIARQGGIASAKNRVLRKEQKSANLSETDANILRETLLA